MIRLLYIGHYGRLRCARNLISNWLTHMNKKQQLNTAKKTIKSADHSTILRILIACDCVFFFIIRRFVRWVAVCISFTLNILHFTLSAVLFFSHSTAIFYYCYCCCCWWWWFFWWIVQSKFFRLMSWHCQIRCLTIVFSVGIERQKGWAQLIWDPNQNSFTLE